MRACNRNLLILMTATILLASCEAPQTRSTQMRRWLSESGKGCEATAAVLKKLRRGVAAFEKIYAEEEEKTQAKGRPFQRYNPQFVTRLEGALAAIDTTQGPLANQLSTDVWPSHYRFVKRAPQMLPRLHRLLVLLAQLQSTVLIARALERRFGKVMRPLSATGKNPKPPKPPTFGVMIKDHRRVVFLAKVPQPKKRKDGPKTCGDAQNTRRVFSPTDPELMNRVECRGRDKIVFTAHLYHLVQIKLILAKIKKLDPRGLAIAFRRSAE